MARMGRPTNNPKIETINFRITKNDKEFLLDYAKNENLTLTNLFNQFIELLKGKKK